MTKQLEGMGYHVAMLHGGKSQDQREESIKASTGVRVCALVFEGGGQGGPSREEHQGELVWWRATPKRRSEGITPHVPTGPPHVPCPPSSPPLQGFREDLYNVLVATDVAGRGIDVPGIALVVNYDMAHTIEA